MREISTHSRCVLPAILNSQCKTLPSSSPPQALGFGTQKHSKKTWGDHVKSERATAAGAAHFNGPAGLRGRRGAAYNEEDAFPWRR